MADGSFMSLYSSDTNINIEETRSFRFGIIEDSTAAQFVVTTRNEGETRTRRIGEFSVPVYGFMNEVITLETVITTDLLLRITATTSHRPTHEENWEYTGLTFTYKLPDNQ